MEGRFKRIQNYRQTLLRRFQLAAAWKRLSLVKMSTVSVEVAKPLFAWAASTALPVPLLPNVVRFLQFWQEWQCPGQTQEDQAAAGPSFRLRSRNNQNITNCSIKTCGESALPRLEAAASRRQTREKGSTACLPEHPLEEIRVALQSVDAKCHYLWTRSRLTLWMWSSP